MTEVEKGFPVPNGGTGTQRIDDLQRDADFAVIDRMRAVQFVDIWRSTHFSLVLSEYILAEVERTLSNSYFGQRLSVDDREAFRHLLSRHAVITEITVSVSGVATHPEDDMVLATALCGNAQFLVTGDYKLVERRQYQGLTVVTVREFLGMLPGLSGEPNG